MLMSMEVYRTKVRLVVDEGKMGVVRVHLLNCFHLLSRRFCGSFKVS